MGITYPTLKIIAKLVDEQKHLKNKKALFFSYPDILCSRKQIIELFGSEIYNLVRFRDDYHNIASWHKCGHITKHFVESVHFFKLLGYEITVLDKVAVRGPEQIHNNNTPLDLNETYNIVVDNILQHCSNFSQAIDNIIRYCAREGFVVHIHPFTMINHGFFTIAPQFYYSFYPINGFRIVEHRFLKVFDDVTDTIKFNPFKRYRGPIDDSLSQVIVVERIDNYSEIEWPIQEKFHKYQKLDKDESRNIL